MKTLFVEALRSPALPVQPQGAQPGFVVIMLTPGLLCGLRGLRTRCADLHLAYVGVKVSSHHWGVDPDSPAGMTCSSTLDVSEHGFKFVLELEAERFVSAFIRHDEMPGLLAEKSSDIFYAQGPDDSLRAAVAQVVDARANAAAAASSADHAVR